LPRSYLPFVITVPILYRPLEVSHSTKDALYGIATGRVCRIHLRFPQKNNGEPDVMCGNAAPRLRSALQSPLWPVSPLCAWWPSI